MVVCIHTDLTALTDQYPFGGLARCTLHCTQLAMGLVGSVTDPTRLQFSYLVLAFALAYGWLAFTLFPVQKTALPVLVQAKARAERTDNGFHRWSLTQTVVYIVMLDLFPVHVPRFADWKAEGYTVRQFGQLNG